jgi:hypothetical protein
MESSDSAAQRVLRVTDMQTMAGHRTAAYSMIKLHQKAWVLNLVASFAQQRPKEGTAIAYIAKAQANLYVQALLSSLSTAEL